MGLTFNNGRNAAAMTSTSSLSVGINCTPNAQFEVLGSTGGALTDGIRVSRNTLQSSQYGVINYSSGILNLTGVNTSGGGEIRFNTSDATTTNERMRITSAGNVGIGSTNPLSLLEVKGATPFIRITDTSTTTETGLVMDANGAIRGGLTINYGTGEFKHYCGVAGNSYFQTFHTNGSERMRITTAGNVGISTSTPYSPLQVNGNIHRAWTSAGTTGSPASQEGFVYSEQSNANALAGMWFENNFQSGSAVSVILKYRTNGASVTEGIRLTSTGDTEFQGTNSSAKFKFWNNYSNSQPGIAVYNTSGTEIFSFNGNTSGLSISGYVSTPIYYGTANSASLAANSTTSYSQWQVSGSRSGYGGFVDTYSGMAVMHDSGGSGGFYRQASGKWTIYWSAGNNCVGIGNSTTVNWAAACTNGTMFYTSESYATYDMYARSFIPTSDIRLKENIVPLESSLDKIKQLEGVSYNRIEDIEKKREIGFIAQSVQQVIPEIVNYHEDTDTYGVDYDKITVLLTEALKEEDRKVLSLEAKIQEIETRLANL